MKSGFAKISIRNPIGAGCLDSIKTELLKIKDISNVRLYPEDALVVFNFIKANELAEALNALVSLGHPPREDKKGQPGYGSSLCGCHHTDHSMTEARHQQVLRV